MGILVRFTLMVLGALAGIGIALVAGMIWKSLWELWEKLR